MMGDAVRCFLTIPPPGRGPRPRPPTQPRRGRACGHVEPVRVPRARIGSLSGDHRSREPEPLGFAEPRGGHPHRPQLAGQPDFAEHHRTRSDGPVRGASKRARRRPPDRPRALLSVSPPTTLRNTSRSERESGLPLQHGEQQRESTGIESSRHALRRPVRAGGDQRLDLDQQRPTSTHATRRSRRGPRAAQRVQKNADGFSTLEPRPRHPEDSDLLVDPAFFCARSTR